MLVQEYNPYNKISSSSFEEIPLKDPSIHTEPSSWCMCEFNLFTLIYKILLHR
jgi:hypothetical protein